MSAVFGGGGGGGGFQQQNSIPPPPPPPPPPPAPPTLANASGVGAALGARIAAAGAYANTVRSSPQGVTGETATASKKLLGD